MEDGEVVENLRAIGVVEGLTDGGGVRIALVEGLAGEEVAALDASVERLRLVAVEPGRYAVVLDTEGTGIENRLIEVEKERLARLSMAEDDLFEQADEMSGTPVAEGTDGVDDAGRPVDGRRLGGRRCRGRGAGRG